MQTQHEDKAMTAATKLSGGAKAVFDHAVRRVGLAADDENAIGLQVALTLEAKDRMNWMPAMEQAAEPTIAEAKAIADAQAAYGHQQAAVAKARERAYDAARARHNFMAAAEGAYRDGRHPAAAEGAQLEAAAHAAELVLDEANRELDGLSKRLQKARAAAIATAVVRQRRVVGGL